LAATFIILNFDIDKYINETQSKEKAWKLLNISEILRILERNISDKSCKVEKVNRSANKPFSTLQLLSEINISF